MESNQFTGDNGNGEIFSHCYAQLMHQQTMLEDKVRVQAYHEAITRNPKDFKDKVVMDVGAGCGILSFFSCQAGAKRVYAVEMSKIAQNAKKLIEGNGLSDFCEVIKGRVEDIDLPEKVDILVSEPIGFLLVHERMLESYIIARDRHLAPGGAMFPQSASIVVAPFSDICLHDEQKAKASFWSTENFYGYNVSSLKDESSRQYFSQVIIDCFDSSILISDDRSTFDFDFKTITTEKLKRFEIPLKFEITKTSLLTGLACWFTIDLSGSEAKVILSTAPECPRTHWHQTRLLLEHPLAVNRGQSLSGSLKFQANAHSSYNIVMQLKLDGTNNPIIITENKNIALHQQVWQY